MSVVHHYDPGSVDGEQDLQVLFVAMNSLVYRVRYRHTEQGHDPEEPSLNRD